MVKVNIISEDGKPIHQTWIGTESPEDPSYVVKGVHLETEYLDWYAPPGKKSFIETGTYKGETVARMVDYGFKYVRSVDLTRENLYPEFDKIVQDADAQPDRDVKLILGDSPDAIPKFLKEVLDFWPNPNDREVVFWLDAHASGDLPGGRSGGSPLLDELRSIEADSIKTHTIFIDDRRLFGSAEWSFVKEEECLEILRRINPYYQFHYLDGQIRNDVLVATVYNRRPS